MLRTLAVCALLTCCFSLAVSSGSSRQAEQEASLQRLFAAIDRNQDGQLSAAETETYAAASLDLRQEGWSARAASEASRQALDGPDAGATVSPAELAAHLQDLLQDHQVEEWVSHGLNLPQYAPAFRQAAITALDFPFLVADGGASLEADLAVTSRLHQQQILRGMKRLTLGLGQLPSEPQQLECRAVNKTTIALSWRAPASPGHPTFHKYVLQRQRLSAAGGAVLGVIPGGRNAATCSLSGGEERWETAGEPDDEDFSWMDSPPARGSFRYRLAAWSAFGHSPFAVTDVTCTIKAVQRRPALPPAAAAQLVQPEVQALLAAVAAAGNLSGPQASLSGGTSLAKGVWSWSAASSAAVVALTILLKASQLRVGSALLAIWRKYGPGSWQHAEAGAVAASNASADAAGGVRQAEQSGTLSLPQSNSSRALAPLEAPDQEHLLQQHGSQSLLYSASSGQQLSGNVSSQLGSSAWQLADCAAAAGPGCTLGNEAAEQLQQAIKRGAHCAHPGCHRRLDRLRDLRRKLESHYCGLCQHVYCLQHTRISPHGPRGGCGLESQCICFGCFDELAPQQQAACERINRLTVKPSVEAGAVSMEVAAQPTALYRPGERPSDDCAEQPPASSADECRNVAPALAPAAACAEGGDSQDRQIAGARGVATSSRRAEARRRWRTAGAVMRAVLRFKAAGSNPASPR